MVLVRKYLRSKQELIIVGLGSSDPHAELLIAQDRGYHGDIKDTEYVKTELPVDRRVEISQF